MDSYVKDVDEVGKVHSDVFQVFVEYIPDVVYTLKNCDHGYNIHKPNDYHMEGDVWTHTCMAYQSLLYIPQFHELDEDQRFLTCVAVLCHDLGKPFKKFLNEYNRYRFGGHERRSVVELINILDLLVNVYNMSTKSIYDLMLVVSAHSEYWLRDSLQEVLPLLNYDMNLMDVYKVVATADQRGQLCKSTHAAKKDIYAMSLVDVERKEFDGSKQSVFIMIGPPASGKDYIIKTHMTEDVKVLSFDKMRVDLYLNHLNIHNKLNMSGDAYRLITPPTQLYSEAWKWCNDTKKNFDSMLQESIIEELLYGHSVAISNTNMTIKSRRKLITFLKSIKIVDINIIGCLVYSDFYTLGERDNSRRSDDKTVGEQVIRKMCNNFEVPTMDEGFDNIMTFLNL